MARAWKQRELATLQRMLAEGSGWVAIGEALNRKPSAVRVWAGRNGCHRTGPSPVRWSPADRELVAARWKDGWSAGQIAKELGGQRTRNAVVGQLHRMGLLGRGEPSKPTLHFYSGGSPKAARPARPKPPKPPRQNKPALVWGANEKARPKAPTHAERREAFATIPPTAAPLIGRPFGACAWPVGTPDTPANQLACCAPKAEGWPYCEAHARIAAGAPARKSGKDYVRAILRLAA